MASKRWKKISLMVIALLLLLTLLPAAAFANVPAYDGDKVDVVADPDTPLVGPEYSFIPQFTASSKAIPFGSNLWRDTTWSAKDSRKFHSIELTNPTNRDGLKGKIGVKYTNVGTYNGQAVDLKITVTNWLRFGLPGRSGKAARVGNISFEDGKIALSTQGYHFVDTTWQYFKAGTNDEIKVTGYFTFSDVDLTQSLQLSNKSAANIDRYLIEDRTNRLRFTTVSSQHKFFDPTDVDVTDTVFDHRYAFTFLYSNLGSFSLRWQTDWTKTKNGSVRGGKLTSSRYYYSNTVDYAVGEYMFFVINKPGETIIKPPPTDPGAKGPTMIEIWTNKAGTTNPVNEIKMRVNLFEFVGTNLDASKYVSSAARFEVRDKSTGTVVYSGSVPINALPTKYEFTVPSNYLAKDKKTDYEYVLTIPSLKPRDYECGRYRTEYQDTDGDPKTPMVPVRVYYSKTCTEYFPETPYFDVSYGYTSSEKEFTVNTAPFETKTPDGKVKSKFSYEKTMGDFYYEDVVKTTKYKNGSMHFDKEKVTINFPILDAMKTGYEFGPKMMAVYRNELSTPDTTAQHLEKIDSDFLVDTRLVDSMLDKAYSKSAKYPNKLAIPIRDTVELTSRDKKQQQMQIMLPFTNVERVTGKLYSDEQVTKKMAKKGIAGRERKLYAPIWLDISKTDYTYGYKSTKPIGVHDIHFDIQDASVFNLNFYAHMYSHTDSQTQLEDELLIHPLIQGGWGPDALVAD